MGALVPCLVSPVHVNKLWSNMPIYLVFGIGFNNSESTLRYFTA